MILRRPVFWLILVFAALMAFVPLRANNVSLREDLILVAIAIILASNLNLMIGYTGYVNFGHIVFYGLGGYIGLYLATVRNWNLVLAALAAGLGVSLFALALGTGHSSIAGRLFRAGHHRRFGGCPILRRQLRSLGQVHRHVRCVRRVREVGRSASRALDHLLPGDRRDGSVDDSESGH